MTWAERADVAATRLRQEQTVDLDDLRALEDCAARNYEPYYTLKCLIVRLEADDGTDE